jgi:hypothetical protein
MAGWLVLLASSVSNLLEMAVFCSDQSTRSCLHMYCSEIVSNTQIYGGQENGMYMCVCLCVWKQLLPKSLLTTWNTETNNTLNERTKNLKSIYDTKKWTQFMKHKRQWLTIRYVVRLASGLTLSSPLLSSPLLSFFMHFSTPHCFTRCDVVVCSKGILPYTKKMHPPLFTKCNVMCSTS